MSFIISTKKLTYIAGESKQSPHIPLLRAERGIKRITQETQKHEYDNNLRF